MVIDVEFIIIIIMVSILIQVYSNNSNWYRLLMFINFEYLQQINSLYTFLFDVILRNTLIWHNFCFMLRINWTFFIMDLYITSITYLIYLSRFTFWAFDGSRFLITSHTFEKERTHIIILNEIIIQYY